MGSTAEDQARERREKRTRRAVVRGVALSVVCAACAIACTVVNGLTVPQKPVVETPAGDAAPPDLCNHARIPLPPNAENDGTNGMRTVFALKELDFGTADAGANVLGYDLDNTCTCFKAADAAPEDKPGPDTCIGRGSKTIQHCDGVGGRDNALAVVVSAAGTAIRLDDFMNSIIRDGRGGLLVELYDYNGEDNDAHVTLGLYPSRGTYRDAGDPDGNPEYVDPTTTNRWSYDSDYAKLRPSGVAGSDLISPGFVRDGMLVVNLNDKDAIPLVGLSLKLSDAHFVARIEHSDPFHPTLGHAVIAGRWNIQNIYAAMGRFPANFGSDHATPICSQTLVFENVLRPKICAVADIATDPGKDNAPELCDALSIAIGATTVPAEIGDPVPITPIDECPDGSTQLDCDAALN